MEVGTSTGLKPTMEQTISNFFILGRIAQSMLRGFTATPSAKVARCNTGLRRGEGHDGQPPIFITEPRKIYWSTHATHRHRIM